MNNEQRKYIEQLSRLYFTEFGLNPSGLPIFRWMRTDEIVLLFKRESESRLDPTIGLYTLEPTYKKRTAADTMGLMWVVAKWDPPVSEAAWFAEHGVSVPWPREGYYRPIDNTYLHIDHPPDANLSAQAAFALRSHLGMDYTDFLEIEMAQSAYKRKELDDRISDMVDDAAPAFGNNPGGKTHVSLPSTRTL